MRYLVAVFISALLGVIITSCAVQGGSSASKAEAKLQPSIYQLLEADGRYKILLGAIRKTDLEEMLKGDGSTLTFFAPLDEAFERVPKLAELLEDSDRLQRVLNHHLIPNRVVTTEMLRELAVLQPKEGETLKVKSGDKWIEINDAKILSGDREASNGVLHGIDHVLMRDNDSMLREAGSAIERGLKKGAKKIENAFKDD